MRALLVQNLILTWRYSVGNPYQQFSFPEGVDVAQVMGEFGVRRDRPRLSCAASLIGQADAVPQLEAR